MFSATSVAKTIEIEPTEKAIENSIVLEETSSNEEIEHTLCWEVGRTYTDLGNGTTLMTIRYRCTEYPNSGLGNGIYYINAQ